MADAYDMPTEFWPTHAPVLHDELTGLGHDAVVPPPVDGRHGIMVAACGGRVERRQLLVGWEADHAAIRPCPACATMRQVGPTEGL